MGVFGEDVRSETVAASTYAGNYHDTAAPDDDAMAPNRGVVMQFVTEAVFVGFLGLWCCW